MARPKSPFVMPKKFVQLPSGAVYAHTPMLAKRRGAVPVSGQQAADYLRSIGAPDTNPICKAFPPVEEVIEAPARKSKSSKAKKRAAALPDDEEEDSAPTGMVMSDRPMTDDELKAALDGVSGSE